MIACSTCAETTPTERRRGGPSGLPDGWISIVSVTQDHSQGLDSVDHRYSGAYCSTGCLTSAVSQAVFRASNSVRPHDLIIRETVVETREMQATRIGLTVLDVLDALSRSETDAGALIPLTTEFEDLPQTCVLTVARVELAEVPPGLIEEIGEAHGLVQ
jgi:hypothetical protein